MGWDDTPFENGFRLEGDLENSHKPNSNPVFAYTFDLGNSWLSYESRNLNDLVIDTLKRDNFKPKPKLRISVPPNGGLARWFDLLRNPKTTLDRKLRIHIFTDQTSTQPGKIIVFHNIALAGPPKPFPHGFTNPSAKVSFEGLAKIFTVNYGSISPA